MTVDELMKRIQRDRQYWGSNGGITLSGGEPMFQPEFALKILKYSYDSNIHTAIETCGYIKWRDYVHALDYIDWIFFDLKHMNDKIHQLGTGVSNRLILENARKIASLRSHRMIFRIPVIPGFNDSIENIIETAEFMRKIDMEEVDILPFHPLGASKYEQLGIKYEYKDKDVKPPGTEKMEEIKRIFEDRSIRCGMPSQSV